MQQATNVLATSGAGWEVTEPGILELDRYLSNTNAPDLEEDARLCIASGERMLVLDCSELTYMTGAGARAFLNIARMMYETGGKFFVQNLSGQPRDIFDACGLAAFIPVITAAQRSQLAAVAA